MATCLPLGAGTYEIRVDQLEAFIKARGGCDTLVASLTPRRAKGGAGSSSLVPPPLPALALLAAVCGEAAAQLYAVEEERRSGEGGECGTDEMGQAAVMDAHDEGIEESKGDGIAEPLPPPAARQDACDLIERLMQPERYRQWIWWAGTVNEATNSGEDTCAAICTWYNSEGYGAMVQDTHRNAAFKRAIQACVANHWVEIGTGATGFLTAMVLEHHQCARVLRWVAEGGGGV